MQAGPAREGVAGSAVHGPGILAGIAVLLVSLVHVPAGWSALNHFDPPKRWLWALFACGLAAGGGHFCDSKGNRAWWLALVLAGWMILRSLFRDPVDAELEVLFAWLLPVLLFMLAGMARHQLNRRMLGGFLLLAGGLQAALMLGQRLGLDPFFAETTANIAYVPGRMIGTIGYHNQAVDFLALTGAGVFLLTPVVAVQWAVLLCLLAVSVFTGYRGGMFALGAAMMLAQFAQWLSPGATGKRRGWRMVMTGGLIMAVMTAILFFSPNLAHRFHYAPQGLWNTPAVQTRLWMAKVGTQLFAERPWTGWGAGEYARQYLDRLGAALPDLKTHAVLRSVVFAREAHNDGLQFAVEFGMVGLLILAALVVAGGRTWLKMKTQRQPEWTAFTFITAYMFFASLLSFPWQTSGAGPLAGFLLGCLWPGEEAGGKPREKHSAGTACLRGGASTLALILLTWCTCDAWLNQSVPGWLSARPAREVERRLPEWAYRYRALVGAMLAADGEYPGAVTALERSQCGYCDLWLWNNLGHAYAKLGRWPEAVSIYEKWVRCGLDHFKALQNLSIAHENNGQFQQAAEVARRHMALLPRGSLGEIERLVVLELRSGNVRAAQETLDRYQSRWSSADQETLSGFENLAGVVAQAGGDLQSAENHFRAALIAQPGLESAQRNLKQIKKSTPAPSP